MGIAGLIVTSKQSEKTRVCFHSLNKVETTKHEFT